MHSSRFTPWRWKHLFWLVGLMAAPLLFGSVTSEGQSVVAICFGISLLLLSGEFSHGFKPQVPAPLRWLAFTLLILPLVPLPLAAIRLISPATAGLAEQFPVEAGSAAGMLPLTLSVAGTIQRSWEIGLIITAFALARHSASDERFARPFATSVITGVGLLALSDISLRSGDGKSVLGLWELTWGNAAGTFANRNHFADWCVVGAIFASGWALRSLRPLHRARTGASPSARSHRREGQIVIAVVLFALVMVVLSGSRGGLLALAAGTTVWLTLVLRRVKSRKRWLIAGGIAVAGLVLLAGFGDVLIHRLMQTHEDLAERYPKVALWKDTLALAARFPIFGTGPGSFLAAFGHFKSFGGGMTFHHAENDYAQLFAESGFVGAAIFLSAMFFLMRRCVSAAWSRESKLHEPELHLAAVAACVAFAVHALVEFVCQIPATALLAAALAGFLVGTHESIGNPQVLPPPSSKRRAATWLWAVALIVMGLIVGVSGVQWRESKAALKEGKTPEAIRLAKASLKWWPWNSRLQLASVRTRIKALPRAMDRQSEVASIRKQLSRAIFVDPLNWELRHERAWVDLMYGANQPAALAEAREVTRLQPLQPKIPIEFARYLARRDPEQAWKFLEAADLSSPVDLREALSILWNVPGERLRLWTLVSTNSDAIAELGDFARGRGATGMALEAYRQLEGRIPNAELAEKYLLAERPDLALAQIPARPVDARENLAGAKASLALRHYARSIEFGERVWSSSELKVRIEATYPTPETSTVLLARWKSGATDKSVGRQLAETVFNQPPAIRDLALLRDIGNRFPDEPRLLWMLYRAYSEAGDLREASGFALRLATMAAKAQR